ncbi:hypothetical protein YIM_22300 [Amycolatopsis sp. YIM 10]|nr:hypothetical protein YIM_22300 [Amycolatopsis sp. YIM 10]
MERTPAPLAGTSDIATGPALADQMPFSHRLGGARLSVDRYEEDDMRAKAGDWLIVKGLLGSREQRACVLEACGPDDGPPYVVRWLGDDHVSMFFPENETRVVTADEQRRLGARERERLAGPGKAASRT